VDEIFNRATSKESTSKVTCMILSKDISVVVQGPIHTQDNLTKRVLESVRTHLPDAELILSTWKGSQIDGLDCDVLLLNDDPGAINGRNNVNRQIVSTRNGLQKATRTYAVKLRTDMQLTGTGFIDAFDKYPERREDFKVFERKIVIPTICTRNPFHLNPYLFHPSDIFHFGLKSDMLLLWNIPMATESDVKNLVPEQYIWLNALKSMSWNINLSELHLKEKFRLNEISLVNNFIVDTPRNLDLLFPERLMGGFCSSCYSISEIKQMIERYITKNLNSLPISSLLKLPVFFILAVFFTLTAQSRYKKILMNLSEKKRREQVI
jgi:hypothetical protein